MDRDVPAVDDVEEEEARFRRVDLERLIVLRDLWLPSNMELKFYS